MDLQKMVRKKHTKQINVTHSLGFLVFFLALRPGHSRSQLELDPALFFGRLPLGFGRLPFVLNLFLPGLLKLLL
jgi:hypothetical protein